MAKKNLFKIAGLSLTAAGAFALGTGTAPVGQEVLTAAQNTQVVQKSTQAKKATTEQQTQQQQAQKVRASAQHVYLPWHPGERVYGKFSMTPKEYGEYLMQSGKDKYNKRRRKYRAKAFA